MTEAIVCAVIAAIAAVAVGLINAFSQKKTKQDLSAEFQKELQEAREKERARQKYEVYMIKGIMASNTLSEATARAVQRIPDEYHHLALARSRVSAFLLKWRNYP